MTTEEVDTTIKILVGIISLGTILACIIIAIKFRKTNKEWEKFIEGVEKEQASYCRYKRGAKRLLTKFDNEKAKEVFVLEEYQFAGNGTRIFDWENSLPIVKFQWVELASGDKDWAKEISSYYGESLVADEYREGKYV